MPAKAGIQIVSSRLGLRLVYGAERSGTTPRACRSRSKIQNQDHQRARPVSDYLMFGLSPRLGRFSQGERKLLSCAGSGRENGNVAVQNGRETGCGAVRCSTQVAATTSELPDFQRHSESPKEQKMVIFGNSRRVFRLFSESENEFPVNKTIRIAHGFLVRNDSNVISRGRDPHG
jgi:hypothetical protein